MTARNTPVNNLLSEETPFTATTSLLPLLPPPTTPLLNGTLERRIASLTLDPPTSVSRSLCAGYECEEDVAEHLAHVFEREGPAASDGAAASPFGAGESAEVADSIRNCWAIWILEVRFVLMYGGCGRTARFETGIRLVLLVTRKTRLVPCFVRPTRFSLGACNRRAL